VKVEIRMGGWVRCIPDMAYSRPYLLEPDGQPVLYQPIDNLRWRRTPDDALCPNLKYRVPHRVCA
jgi:hypothetical protein